MPGQAGSCSAVAVRLAVRFFSIQTDGTRLFPLQIHVLWTASMRTQDLWRDEQTAYAWRLLATISVFAERRIGKDGDLVWTQVPSVNFTR